MHQYTYNSTFHYFSRSTFCCVVAILTTEEQRERCRRSAMSIFIMPRCIINEAAEGREGANQYACKHVGLILLNQMVRTLALITAGSPRIYDGTFDTISQFSFSTIAAGLSQIFHVAS